MKKFEKFSILVILSISLAIGWFNLPYFIKGDNNKTVLLMTIIYISSWIILYVIANKKRNKLMLKFTQWYWTITAITIVITMILFIFSLQVVMLLFNIVLLSPLQGTYNLVNDINAMMFISFIISVAFSFLSYKSKAQIY